MRSFGPRSPGKPRTERVEFTLTGLPVKHGTMTAYVSHGCGCEDCRAANAAYGRAYRAKRRADRAATSR